MSSPPDVLVAGRYRLVERIANGGMSTVWEAWDERLHRRVALKQLRLQAGLTPDEALVAADRALREGRITARLHHPHAVPVYDVVDDNGSPCLIMQYLPSRSLQAVLAARGTLEVGEVARIGAEIASALAAAHEAGIVHRDVKPGNVLVDDDGEAKLTDFGISHALGDVNLTSTGMVTGTPAYLAPEAARGEPSGFPADVFALGATLYTALEGTPPVGDSDNPIAVLHRAASGQLNRPTRNSPLTSLLDRMLALDPAARPTMPEVAGELERIARQSSAPGSAITTERLAALLPAPPDGGPPPSTTVVLPPARGDAPPPAFAAAAAPPAARPPAGPRPQPARRRPARGPLIALAVVVGLLLLTGFVLLGVYLTRDGSGSPSGTGQGLDTTQPPANRTHSSASHPSSHSRSATHSSSPHSTSSQPTTSKPPPSSSSTSPSSSSGGTSSGAYVTAIENYYSLLPGDTNDAWGRLTPSYQSGHAGGRSGYEQFWHQFSAVSTSNVHSIGTGAVEATLTYTYRNGKRTTEVTDFQLVDDGGTLKINDSEVVG